MNNFQTGILLFIFIISLYATFKGLLEVVKKQNPFGEPHVLFWLGIFVWGDAVVLGLFWFLVSLFCLFTNDWQLFLLIVSVFWVVRSLGEIHYWISQQFSPIIRNPPQTLFGYRWFKNDSIWFIYQLFWQCILIFSIIFTIYFANLWTKI
jgi:hypothetical protein